MAHFDFTIPSLDRETYKRLREMKETNGISQHGLVTLAINLLYQTLNGEAGSQGRDLLSCIQATTGITRLDKPI